MSTTPRNHYTTAHQDREPLPFDANERRKQSLEARYAALEARYAALEKDNARLDRENAQLCAELAARDDQAGAPRRARPADRPAAREGRVAELEALLAERDRQIAKQGIAIERLQQHAGEETMTIPRLVWDALLADGLNDLQRETAQRRQAAFQKAPGLTAKEKDAVQHILWSNGLTFGADVPESLCTWFSYAPADAQKSGVGEDAYREALLVLEDWGCAERKQRQPVGESDRQAHTQTDDDHAGAGHPYDHWRIVPVGLAATVWPALDAGHLPPESERRREKREHAKEWRERNKRKREHEQQSRVARLAQEAATARQARDQRDRATRERDQAVRERDQARSMLAHVFTCAACGAPVEKSAVSCPGCRESIAPELILNFKP